MEVASLNGIQYHTECQAGQLRLESYNEFVNIMTLRIPSCPGTKEHRTTNPEMAHARRLHHLYGAYLSVN